MRVSVPSIPHGVLSRPTKPISTPLAIERIGSFLAPGKATVLTGAGVSVDSGIRAYRGKDGRYMNPNYKPIFYHELVDDTKKGHEFRQRYWLRSYLGYPPVRDAVPNRTHFAIAALQYTSFVIKLITQNVDGLHHKAISHIWNESRRQEGILELHGSLHSVRCEHGHIVDRDIFQDWLSTANPRWKGFADKLERSGNQPRTNPDGDVELDGVKYDDFFVPDCPSCLLDNRRNSVHKPQVIFFGESIPNDIKDRSFHDIDCSDRLLVIGTTLATYSAFRLLRRALSQRKPVLLVNVGPTRADGILGVEKIDTPSGTVMGEVVKAVLGREAAEGSVVQQLLNSGVNKPPLHDNRDVPRAAG